MSKEWKTSGKPFKTTEEDILFAKSIGIKFDENNKTISKSESLGPADSSEYVESPSQILKFTKKTKSYVSENTLKDLVKANIVESYEIKHNEEGSEVTLIFRVEPY